MARRASTTAGNVDALFIFLLIVSGLMTLLIFSAVIYFAARYRHRSGVLAEQIEGSTPLELTWSIIPLVVFMVIFAVGSDRLLSRAARLPATPPKSTSSPSSGCGSSSTPKASAKSTSFTFPSAATSS